MELRVCAEDPAAGFVPQVGTIASWREPADIRVDTAIESGMAVSPFYDSMLAKYLAWAPTREACIGKLTLACERSTLLGIRSNLAFLSQAINHPTFRQGGVTTAFLGTEDVCAGYWATKPGAYAEAAAALTLGGLADAPATLRPADGRHRACLAG
ncbi:hypothetical protein AWV80_21955 [Cupriavidus sp. UYMU48A]|nr:hypothetical protein AWV80_21955 [Cupriavidus sp. UYMU48A]